MVFAATTRMICYQRSSSASFFIATPGGARHQKLCNFFLPLRHFQWKSNFSQFSAHIVDMRIWIYCTFIQIWKTSVDPTWAENSHQRHRQHNKTEDIFQLWWTCSAGYGFVFDLISEFSFMPASIWLGKQKQTHRQQNIVNRTYQFRKFYWSKHKNIQGTFKWSIRSDKTVPITSKIIC